MTTQALTRPGGTRTHRISRTGRAAAAFAAALLLPASLPAAAQKLSEGVVAVRLAADADKLVAGKPFRLAVVADVKEHWHVNSNTPKEDYLIPTTVSLEPAAGLTFGKPVYPPHKELKLSFSETKLAVYEGSTVIRVEGQVDAKAAPGPRTLTAVLSFQPCDDKQCLPPAKKTATLTIEVAKAGTAASPANQDLFPGAPKAGPPKADAGGDGAAGAGVSGTVSPVGEPATPGSLRARWDVKGVPTLVFLGKDGKELGGRVTGFEPPDRFLGFLKGEAKSADASVFAGKSIPVIVLLVFLSGLALNLTPCVYPLIPITLGFFGRQQQGKGTFKLALLYVLGMSATYSALGVFAALSGSLFGAALQKPAVLIGIAVLVVALALSMFGLYEIQAPHFITDRTGSQAGALGAMTMGLFVGFVAAPCIGPFVLSLLTFVAASGSVLVGFGLFFTLAMGLGVPYLLLGTFTGSLRKLPRSGEWMVAVRNAFGFVLLSLAVYFLRPLLAERLYEILLALPLAVGGVYFLFFEKSGRGLPWFRIVKVAVAVTFLAAGAVFARPQRGGPKELVFLPYSQAVMDAAAKGGKPVMLDFYADWCLPCKELDHKTFSDPKVVAALQDWVLLKVDLTHD